MHHLGCGIMQLEYDIYMTIQYSNDFNILWYIYIYTVHIYIDTIYTMYDIQYNIYIIICDITVHQRSGVGSQTEISGIAAFGDGALPMWCSKCSQLHDVWEVERTIWTRSKLYLVARQLINLSSRSSGCARRLGRHWRPQRRISPMVPLPSQRIHEGMLWNVIITQISSCTTRFRFGSGWEYQNFDAWCFKQQCWVRYNMVLYSLVLYSLDYNTRTWYGFRYTVQ